MIRDERGDIPAVLLRIAGVYDDGCHSIPLAHQIQRIYERQLTSRLYRGSTAHGQSFLHMDDLVDAIARGRRATRHSAAGAGAAARRGGDAQLRRASAHPRPPDPRRSLGRRSRSRRRSRRSPRLGAWVQDKTPGPRAVHPAVDDRPRQRPLRARHHTRPHAAGLGADPLAARHAPQDGRGAQGRPARLVPRQRAGAARARCRKHATSAAADGGQWTADAGRHAPRRARRARAPRHDHPGKRGRDDDAWGRARRWTAMPACPGWTRPSPTRWRGTAKLRPGRTSSPRSSWASG